MVISKIVYDTREALKIYADDSEISDALIIHRYNLKRATLLRQDLNNFQRTTDNSVTQTLCLGLEDVSANQCGLTIECDTIYRTKRPLPQPLELHTKVAITNVRSTNRISIPFNFTSKEKAIYSKHSPFNNAVYCFLDNDRYLYLLSERPEMKMLECLTITGVFEDPLELTTYSNCCDCVDPNPCYDSDTTNYPIQPHYIDVIRDMIVKEFVAELQLKEDKDNDANDN